MNKTVSDLSLLLRSMEPTLNEGVYVYALVPPGFEVGPLSFAALIREREGMSVVVPEREALRAELPVLFRAAWITLAVPSNLHASGFTAAFSSALAAAGIACNVVAGAYHDHIFVPYERANEAMTTLRRLQHEAMGGAGGEI
jgi:uncharacterized protein